MDHERDNEIDAFEYEFWNLVEKSFNLRLEGMSTSASPYLNGHISFNARFASKNKNLKNTPYFYCENNKIVHFTSLSSLYSIINEGAVRLYNLHKTNDPNEYTYASEKLKDIYNLQGLNEGQLKKHFDRIKEYSFILSGTSFKALENDSFWEKYADNGKGVAIVFEFINPLEEWEFFYCSNIFYNKLEAFNKLKESWENLLNKNQHINYSIDLDQFLSLHKPDDWSNEQEIRLLTLYPDLHSQPFETRIYRDFKPSLPERNIKYYKLPLCDKNGQFIEKELENRIEFYWKLIPRIRISDIYFGPNTPIKERFWDSQLDIKYYIAEKLNCWLKNLPRVKFNDYTIYD